MELNNTTDFSSANETSPELEPEVDFMFEFLVPSVFLNGVGILGLVGNLLSIFILSRPQMKGSTNCILIGLATYDSILILSRWGPLPFDGFGWLALQRNQAFYFNYGAWGFNFKSNCKWSLKIGINSPLLWRITLPVPPVPFASMVQWSKVKVLRSKGLLIEQNMPDQIRRLI